MKKNITATFSEYDQLNQTTDYVLYLPLNSSHFKMAKIMAENSKLESFIYYDGYQSMPSEESWEYRLISNAVTVSAMLPAFTKIVCFIPHISINAPGIYKKIIVTAMQSNISIYEVPHGLFQTGYNLIDDSTSLDITSYYDGIGINLPAVTKKRISWYGDNGIGYPSTMKRDTIQKRILPSFTLISSNTNWYLYSLEDKRKFYTSVFSFAEKNPDSMFIWSPHPAELNAGTYTFALREHLPANIHLYGIKEDIYFHGIDCTDDLIPYCEYGISTLSTCLLDYEIYNKPVNIFSCDGTRNIINSLHEFHEFDSDEQLTSNPKNLKTGFLKDYNPEKFDNFLNQHDSLETVINPGYSHLLL